MATWNFPKRGAFASRVAGLFFPQRDVMGLSRDRFSPAVKAKAVSAAATSKSFAQAQTQLQTLGEITMSDRPLGRLAQEAGQKLLGEQRERAERHARNELPVEVENARAPRRGACFRKRDPSRSPQAIDADVPLQPG
jgi:hypothetical protein